MPTANTTRFRKRGVAETFRVAGFQALFGELKTWRVSDDLKMLESAKGSALILPFVKGLRLSAQLIYMLRRELKQWGLEVDWGHLLDDEDQSCSPECDIIIHYKGNDGEWNGSDDPVMNFKFVKQSRAVAVISCKSFAKGVDAEYVPKLRPYVKHVFLFAECCAPNKVASLRKKQKRLVTLALAICILTTRKVEYAKMMKKHGSVFWMRSNRGLRRR